MIPYQSRRGPLACYTVESSADFLVPARSALYRLSPIGLGTERVEALSSYVARVAAAHLVKPSWLLKSFGASVSAKDTRVLNGACVTTGRVVELLEQRTQLGDLASLTFLPWGNVLSTLNSLSTNQGWCPRCLESWRSEGIPIHYPLLWCLTTVRWCVVHGCRLASQCPGPECGAPIELYAAAGRCRRCFAWLEQADSRVQPLPLSDETDRWFTLASAILVKRGQQPGGVLSYESMRRVFTWLFEVVGDGHWDGLSKRLALSDDILLRWRSGRSLPGIDMFLTFCRRLNIEPDDLLSRDAVGRLDPAALRMEPATHLRAAPRKPNRHPDLRLVRRRLRQALRTDLADAQPLERVAADLGVGSQLLRYHFPELARAISAQWRISCQHRRQAKHREQ